MSGAPRPPGVILAGGQSRRMGRDKTRVLLNGRPLIAHVVDCLRPQTSALVLAGPVDLANEVGLRAIADIEPDRGPLSGLLAGLIDARRTRARATHLLSSAADTPFLPPDLVEKLEKDARNRPVIARSGDRLHSVCGLWPLAVLDPLKSWLEAGNKPAIIDFLRYYGHETVDFSCLDTPAGPRDPFFNINTQDDLEKAQTLLLG